MASSHVLPILSDIPAFTPSGALPPFVGSNPALPSAMSPYQTTLLKLIDRFATSPERKSILSGFLTHRSQLLGLGITGTQWLDGSFLEDIENLEHRPPVDIDTVIFTRRPPALVADQPGWDALIQANINLFMPQLSKAAFKTDPYFVDIVFGPEHVIQQTAYWFGLFSHRRVTSLWKGLLAIVLDGNQDDQQAIELLKTK